MFRKSPRLSMAEVAARFTLSGLAFSGLVLSGCGGDETTVSAPPADKDAVNTQPDLQIGGTDATEDVQPDVPPQTDAVQPDVAPDVPDTADTSGACPGGVGCDCAADDKCDSGKCLDTPAGKKCAQTCTGAGGSCDKGFTCKQIGGGADATSYCVPTMLTLCSPCQFHKDCQAQGLTDALCLDYGSEGKFCGGACTDDNSCPDGYGCFSIKDETSGQTSKQCKKKSTTSPGTGADCIADPNACAKGESCVEGKCAVVKEGVCECSAWAKAAGLQTECGVTNDEGSCKATRKCTPDGLEACKAKTPKAETCNADDDNCDGKIDNLAADYKCAKEAFKDGGSGAACGKDEDCTTAGEACDEAAGKCKPLIGKCFGKPTCAANGELICNDAKTPKLELCNGEDDNCDGQIDEDFTWKDPASGGDLKVGSQCGAGVCTGGTVLCADTVTAVCSTAKKASKEACNDVDDDCDGKTDNLACDDGNVCTTDLCDSKTGSCTNDPNTDPCDDKNACTSADTCAKGQCVGTAKNCSDGKECTEDSCDPKTGVCANPQSSAGASCSDGNACTVGDTCGDNPQSKAFECLPGKDTPKCDDTNVCTDDICDTQKGCVNKPNAETVACYSADEKTKGVGVCKAGTKVCKDGKLDGVCTGEVVPAKSESCDGKDDTCNGTTDEGCKPTSVAVTFSSAYVTGKSGNNTVQMLVGTSGPVGSAKGGANAKYSVDFGFLAWLMQLVK